MGGPYLQGVGSNSSSPPTHIQHCYFGIIPMLYWENKLRGQPLIFGGGGDDQFRVGGLQCRASG